MVSYRNGAARVVNFDARSAHVPLTKDIEDIWPGVRRLCTNLLAANSDEDRIRQQQYRIVNQRHLRVLSIFSDSVDIATQSYFCGNRFYFHFPGREEYFLVTSLYNAGHALGTIYLPERRIAIALYPYTINEESLGEFDSLRRFVTKDPNGAERSLAIIGNTHFMHMLWNEYPALEHAVAAGIAPLLDFAVLYEPFGPTVDVFPEISSHVTVRKLTELRTLNSSRNLILGLGSQTIMGSTQERVRKVAKLRASPSALSDREMFKLNHSPIFWLSVKPPNRTCDEQAAALSKIITGIRHAYSNSGILLNGVSYPWDYSFNDNYPGWFREMMDKASCSTSDILKEVVSCLSPVDKCATKVISDVSICDEVLWGEVCDFYFCHGGTMQNKVGWVHCKPGMVHSNRQFIQSLIAMPAAVDCDLTHYFLPSELTMDDTDDNYTGLQLARKDKNYAFQSFERVTENLISAFEECRRYGR